MRLQPASSRAASCSFNFCSRRAVDIGVIELSHRGNKLPQQQRRRAADRRQWSAWTHPSELPAVLMLSALLRRLFLVRAFRRALQIAVGSLPARRKGGTRAEGPRGPGMDLPLPDGPTLPPDL